jgi:amino acid adenylation domain-containing protein
VAANCIAARLIENGIKHGDAVGICTSRHFGMVASLLGILKSGAAYVPLDPNYPRDRLTYMINDASILMIITDDANQAMVSSIAENVSILMVDPGVSGLYDTTEGTQLVSVPPECTAYIIYTSGSTGKPKGVRIPHSAVVNFLFSMRTAPGLKENDIVAAVTTLSFDISVLEIFLPLITGASCLLIMDEVIRDGIKLLQTIKGNKVTVMQGTPSTWRLLISAGWKGSPDLKALCGGEPLPSDLLKELYPRVYQLWNMYGPTETTVWTTCQLITDPESPVLIGRPIHNTTAYILDETVQPLPVGVHGELYIGGDGLAQGYHNRPELTEAKFISNPFSNGKLYKTGDLARFHEDGKIECLGRIDSQVKIRGFRIELGEIEHVISTHSGVRQSVAVCKEYAPGDLRLLLYYVLHTSGAFTATELRKHLRSFLPDYMIPQHFIELETMPLTPAGKIDRKGLQLPIEIHAAIQSEKKAPVTPGELYLASIWREYLGIAIAYVNDTFFDLGGHSLISIQVISRIKTETGIEVQPKSLMFNTLGEIASIYKLKDNENKNVNTRKNEPIVSRVMRFFRRERNLH